MSFFLYLASASPRRAKLLKQIEVSFEIFPQDIDETIQVNEDAKSFVTRLAREKSEQGLKTINRNILKPENAPVLGSDTIVTLEQHILGKPENKDDAIDMLKLLSGQTHQVITALHLCNKESSRSAINSSEVTFKTLSEDEIIKYCHSGEPMDKAGSYGIQGIAAKFISNINGSYSGIMGLPLFETNQLIEQFNDEQFNDVKPYK